MKENEGILFNLPKGFIRLTTARRFQLLKRTKQVKIFADRRNGKDGWSIYNEIKKLTGDEFGTHLIVSPYSEYALVSYRW